MVEFKIPGLSIELGRHEITGAVLALDGNAALSFDMAAHTVSISSEASLEELTMAIEAAGFDIEGVHQEAHGHDAPGHHCDMCD